MSNFQSPYQVLDRTAAGMDDAVNSNSRSVNSAAATKEAHKASAPWFDAAALPQLLRGLGVVTLLVSVSLYLFQGWGESSDLMRYLLLLGHTVMLAGIGFFCSSVLKEQKGARVLLMLALTFIAANFAIIGGFVYSVWGAPVTDLHGAITWAIEGSASSLLIVVTALFVLAPLVWLGFQVAARRSVRRFTALYLACNSLLLIPSRDEVVLGVVLVLGVVAVLWHIGKARAEDISLATREGRIAQAILFVPLAVMLGRNMMHSVGIVMPLMISASLLLVFRQVAMTQPVESLTRKFLEAFSVVPILSFALCTGALLDDLFNPSFAVLLWGFVLVASGLLFDLSLRAAKGGSVYSVIASLFVVLGFALNLASAEDLLSSVFCLSGGILLVVAGVLLQKRIPIIFGALLSVLGLICSFALVFDSFDFNGWFALAALGTGAIVMASYIEKRGDQAKQQLADLRSRWQNLG